MPNEMEYLIQGFLTAIAVFPPPIDPNSDDPTWQHPYELKDRVGAEIARSRPMVARKSEFAILQDVDSVTDEVEKCAKLLASRLLKTEMTSL